jgi:putative RecB family exonuclease
MTLTTTLNPHPIEHLSFSQHGSYWRCPHAYELERIQRVPSIPAWWFLGGAAVHEATEALDRLLLVGPNVTFDPEIETRNILDQKVKDEVKYKNLNGFDGWFAAGRWPTKNGYTWWWDNAPLMVQRYWDWRERTKWEVAYFNETPGIECELIVTFDFGKFRGAPDRVFRLPSGQLVVADVKSGSTLPKDALQLGTYANALEMLGFERPAWGTYVMVKSDPKDGEELHTPLVPLDKYRTPYLEATYGPTKAAIELGAFPPVVGDACRTCVSQKGCYAFGGEDSARYDRMHPDYQGRTSAE